MGVYHAGTTYIVTALFAAIREESLRADSNPSFPAFPEEPVAPAQSIRISSILPSLKLILPVNGRKRRLPEAEIPQPVPLTETPPLVTDQDKRSKRRKSTSINTGNSIPAAVIGYKFQCENCAAQFRSTALLELHGMSHKMEDLSGFAGSLCCPACALILEDVEALLEHVERHKRSSSPSRSSQHLCRTCGGYFASASHLENHVRRKHVAVETEKQFLCEICREKFATNAALGAHVRVSCCIVKIKELG